MTLFKRLVEGDKLPAYQTKFTIPSPVSGTVNLLDSIDHPAYSQRLFGEGAWIALSGFQIIAPFDASIIAFNDTHDRMRLKGSNGLILQIQLGINAHTLMGEGFKSRQRVGQNVKAGQTLIEFDLPRLKRIWKKPACIITILNSDKTKGVIVHTHRVIAGEDLLMTVLL